jgi:hypothetical protein
MEDLARRLELAEKAFAAAREVLAMRAQYFYDIVGQGVEAAQQTSFLVERGHDAEHSSSHKSVSESLSQRLKLRQRNCLPRPIWRVPRDRGLEEKPAQEAVLETAARAAMPVRRDVAVCSRQRDGWGTAPLAENVRESGQVGELGASGYEERAILFGILDPPSVTFTADTILPDIPQTEEELEFGMADLFFGCMSGIYEEISRDQAEAAVANGKMVYSAFTVWQGDVLERKGRFLVNLSRESQHWPRGSVKMETLPSFGLSLCKNDYVMTWDIKAGYRHFYLHPLMRDFVEFRYYGRYYRCIALPFGWGRSVIWFVKLMRPFVRYIPATWRYRILQYISDFLAAPSDGKRPATQRHCRRACRRIEDLLVWLGLTRHPEKGCWRDPSR